MEGPRPQGEAAQVSSYDFSDDLVTRDLVRPDGELLTARATAAPLSAEAIASNEKPASAPDVVPILAEQKPVVATDATPTHPILVYTASFLLSVYEVDKAQRALKAAVAELGGFVSAQSDTAMTLRVPADRFERALTAIETSGKVRARNVQALDVTEQYRDLGLRLSTAETLRMRLEAMLARAQNVEDALRVERELERIVREIEQIKGTLRSLHDRIAYSTLTVEFRPESRPELDDSDVFQLPYPWLDEIGLHYLLELAR
jgi:hypothetical protein